MDPGSSAGRKYDQEKTRLELLPVVPLVWIALALGYGVVKYGVDNWKRVPDGRTRYTGALLRHLFAAMRGEFLDPESGLPHLAHAGACLLFLLSPLAGDGRAFVRLLSAEKAGAWKKPLAIDLSP